MDPRDLLLNLEKPFQQHEGYAASADQIVLIGLNAPAEYWALLAINWLEQGAPSSTDIKVRLHEIANDKHFPQSVRHKARRLSKQNPPVGA